MLTWWLTDSIKTCLKGPLLADMAEVRLLGVQEMHD